MPDCGSCQLLKSKVEQEWQAQVEGREAQTVMVEAGSMRVVLQLVPHPHCLPVRVACSVCGWLRWQYLCRVRAWLMGQRNLSEPLRHLRGQQHHTWRSGNVC